MRPNKFLATVAVAAITTATAGAVSASTVGDVFITSVTGVWTATEGAATAGIGTNSISWGDPATPDGPSGYTFVGAAPPTAGPFGPDVDFALGEFTHNNFPVFPPSITEATLEVETTGTVDGEAFALTSTFIFDHFETPNNGDPCAAGGDQPCPDLVTPTLNTGASESITVEGVDYFISVSGFMGMDGGFLTLEGESNTATLVGSFTADVPPAVPLPAAGWMLLAGVGGLAALRRRKKAA